MDSGGGIDNYELKYLSLGEAFSSVTFIGLYFAAPWSGPCHAWASVLNSFKLELNTDQHDFIETVLISASIIKHSHEDKNGEERK